MVSSMPPASKVMMISSPIPVMPVPMAPNQSKKAVLMSVPLVMMPMMPVLRIPSSKTNITFTPATAVPNTMR